MPAKVYLVGAGPGDPALLTLRGAECLARADLVLYDYLVNPQLLAHVRPEAERVSLGRHGHGRMLSQDEIHQQMIAAATAGRTVVRLKSGDPAIFGRLAEESHALAAAGVPFEVVPGITSGLASASYAGVTLTDRERASAVALVTGHEDEGKQGDPLDYAALARFPGTLVFYMGVTTAGAWSRALIEAGKAGATPCVIVRRCSWPTQRTFRCRLEEVAAVLDQSRSDKIRPPALVVVGEVASVDPAMAWFTERPLFGQRVLVTRTLEQQGALAAQLTELGADVLLQPVIEVGPPLDLAAVHAAVARLPEFDWLVFASSNGVRRFLSEVWATGDMRKLAGLKLAAIGAGTSAELAAWRLRADLIPPEFRAESLAAALAERELQSPSRAGQRPRALLVRASRGRDVLPQTLRTTGWHVEEVVAYQSVDVAAAQPDIAAAMSAGSIHWTTVTSSAIARSLKAMFGESLQKTRLASISPITSGTLRELGLEPAVEASVYTMDGLLAALTASRP